MTKIMLRILVLSAITTAPALNVLAQGTDFSSTWNLDRESSELPQGRRGDRGGGGVVPETLIITQTATSLSAEQQSEDQSRTVEYALDGTETTVETDNGTLTVSANWDGAVLVTSGIQNLETRRDNFSIKLTERRTLNSDGQTLTTKIILDTPRGDQTFRLVYQKEM
jgi:hypothetical protein